jgi:hypothetical protein
MSCACRAHALRLNIRVFRLQSTPSAASISSSLPSVRITPFKPLGRSSFLVQKRSLSQSASRHGQSQAAVAADLGAERDVPASLDATQTLAVADSGPASETTQATAQKKRISRTRSPKAHRNATSSTKRKGGPRSLKGPKDVSARNESLDRVSLFRAEKSRKEPADNISTEEGDPETFVKAERMPWQSQKAALEKKFPEGWNPLKKLSPDAMDGIRALHEQYPEQYPTEVLAKRFEVSPEAIRRILKSKWRPTMEEQVEREARWERRGESVYERWAAMGKTPPKKWREKGIEPQRHEAFHGAAYRGPSQGKQTRLAVKKKRLSDSVV